MSWKVHIDELTSKLNKACYAIMSVKPFIAFAVLRMICFFLMFTVLNHMTIFRGICSHSKITFRNQKRIVRVITGPVGNCLNNWKSYLPNLIIYFLYYYLLLRIRNCLDLILMYITLMQYIFLTYIYP